MCIWGGGKGEAGAVGCARVWCGVVWRGVVWCGVVWCGVPKVLLPEGNGRDVYPRVQVNGSVVWYGIFGVWRGIGVILVWYGMVLCGMVRCGVVWCGAVQIPVFRLLWSSATPCCSSGVQETIPDPPRWLQA